MWGWTDKVVAQDPVDPNPEPLRRRLLELFPHIIVLTIDREGKLERFYERTGLRGLVTVVDGLKWSEILDASVAQVFDADDELLRSEWDPASPAVKRAMIRGRLGAFQGHKRVWATIVRAGCVGPVLVLEDDVDLRMNHQTISALDASVNYPTPWGVLYAGRNPRVAVTGPWIEGSTVLREVKRTWGLFAHVMKPVAAKRFLERSKQIVEPVDEFISDYKRTGVRLVAISPIFIWIKEDEQGESECV